MGDLVGRETELGAVRAALDASRPILVVGVAGIGKSALIAAATDAADRRPLRGGGLANLTWRPLLALERAVGPFRGGLQPADIAAELARRVGEGVLVLDDLHLADRLTWSVLEHLPRSVQFVAATRSDTPATDEVRRLVERLGGHELELEPLSDEVAHDLVHRRRPDLPPATVRRIVRRAAGIPFYLEQLALAGGQSAKLLRASIRAQLEELDDGARQLLGGLALAGDGLPVDRLGVDHRSLVERGFVSVVEGRAQPRHGLIGEEAAAILTPSQRAAVHRWLVKQVDRVGDAARHAALAGDAELARGLAREAADTAEGEVERTLHQAFVAGLSTGPHGHADRIAAARALLDIGHPDGVDELLAPVDGPASAPEALGLRARAAFELGDMETAEVRLDAALGRLDGHPTRVRAELLTFASRFATHGRADPGAGVTLAQDALGSCETDAQRLETRFALGEALVYGGDLSGTEHLEVVSTHTTDAELAAWSDLILVHALETAERFDEARAAAERGAARARERGTTGWELRFDAALAWQRLLVEGDCLRALADYEALLDAPLGIFRLQAECEYALLLADLGRSEEAEVALASAAPLAANDEGILVHRWAEAEVALLAGHARHAAATARSAIDLDLPLPWTELCVLALSWADHALGRGPRGPYEARGLPLGEAAAQEVEGIRLLADGRPAEAVDAFSDAAAAWTLARYRIRCLLAAGEAARASGDVDRAASVLARAGEEASARGMRVYADRATRRTSPDRDRRGGELLSPREREVVALVAAGLSSREIAARLGTGPVTVDSQIRSAMRKLGARSRTEAAVLAREQTDG